MKFVMFLWQEGLLHDSREFTGWRGQGSFN